MMTIFYDFAVAPPTYEVVTFLCRAECERLQADEDALRIVFLPGPDDGFRRDTLWPRGGAARRQLLRDLCVPLCRLLPSVTAVEVQERRDPHVKGFGVKTRLYGFMWQVQACKRGIRPLRAPGAVVREPDLVTITLREAEHWPDRNSNLPEWLAAAAALQRRGFRVVVVRDTLRAAEPLDGVRTDPEAAVSIPARATLYARAALNLFVSNGTAALALAMDVPAMIFRPVDDGNGLLAFSSRYYAQCGVPKGGQMPGAPPWQRLVWQDDTAETILAAVDAFFAENRQVA